MDDLLIFIRALLTEDPVLLAIFQGYGAVEVDVKEPENRAEAGYPRILLDGDDGSQRAYGENAPPQIIDSELRIEIVTAQDDVNCLDHVEAMRRIQERCRILLFGDPELQIPPLKGIKFTGDSGARWNVSQFAQKSGRRLHVNNPLYRRQQMKYPVQLIRL